MRAVSDHCFPSVLAAAITIDVPARPSTIATTAAHKGSMGLVGVRTKNHQGPTQERQNATAWMAMPTREVGSRRRVGSGFAAVFLRMKVNMAISHVASTAS